MTRILPVSILLFASLSLAGCGDGPSVIDRPDYSGFFDQGSVADGLADDGIPADDGRPDSRPGDTVAGDTFNDSVVPDDVWQDAPDATTDSSGDTLPLDSLSDETSPTDVTTPDGWTDEGTDVSATDSSAGDATTDTTTDAGADFGTGDYTGIYEGLDDVTGVPLVQALCPLVRNNTTTVSYDDAKDILRDDIDNYDLEIQEIYTGKWWDPDASVINVEHTWPQSKGAGSAPMQGDMHHLYLSHSYYNSARSNYPFGYVVEISYDGNDVPPFPDDNCTDKFPTSDWTGCRTYVGDDSLGDRVCEPRDAHKGNTARAIFYFQLRYGGSNCSLKPLSTFDNYGADHVALTEQTLREWNRLDPPDDHERNRNARIAAHEGVRNPFIDHPEFVDRIDFTP